MLLKPAARDRLLEIAMKLEVGSRHPYHNADESKKLLDAGWHVMLFRNPLGSYTAFARPAGDGRDIDEAPEDWIVDDFEPSKALHAITEKVLKIGSYRDWPRSFGPPADGA
jgi:hypothetical protein